MSNFPKTDYASARRQVHEKAWQDYLKSQGQNDTGEAQSKTPPNLTLNRFLLRISK